MSYVISAYHPSGSTTTTQVAVGGVIQAEETDNVIYISVQVATDSGMTNVIFYREGSVDTGGSPTTMYPTWVTQTLAPGTYYVVFRAAYSANNAQLPGSPSATGSFTVTDTAPTVQQTGPQNGSSISWPDNSNYPLQFSWNYSGGTGQSAYEIVVERVSDGAQVYASGKVTSTSKTANWSVPQTYRDVPLRWRMRVYNQYNTASAYTGNSTFTLVTQATVATLNTPADNSLLPWTSGGSAYPLTIGWTYSGFGTQSAYRIVVERASNGTAILDTGNVASSATSASVNIPLAYKDIAVRYRMTVSNSLGTASAFTANRTVTVATAPTATITTPTANQVLSTGTPNVAGTVTCSSLLNVSKIAASIWTGTTKVWEKIVTGVYANGASYSITDSNFFLSPNTSYTYRVEATDSNGVVSPTATQNFTVQYTNPATPGSVTVSASNYDTLGYVSVSWPDTGRDADYLGWEVQREDSMLDDVTGSVLATGAWTTIGTVYTPATTYTFHDYLAPSGSSVRYRVRQIALKFNTQVFGAYSTSTSVTAITSFYWLVGGVNGSASTATTYRCAYVTDDGYTEEYEQSEFGIIGRGRYKERGTPLGANGSLTIKIRNGADGTARAKKMLLEAFKAANTTCYLRNPFGDTYLVSIGDMAVTRIPGVGRAEHVDVTVPYSEVVV